MAGRVDNNRAANQYLVTDDSETVSKNDSTLSTDNSIDDEVQTDINALIKIRE